MKKITKFALFLFLTLCAGLAFAADTTGQGYSGIVVAPNDYSIKYLGMIFGQVGDVLPGSGGPQILGAMFKQFNYGVSVLAILIFAYIYGKGIIDTAAEGQFLGKKANSLWVPLRGVLGMCLLIPSSGTGYNIIQVFAMWVVVQGIGIADQVWNTAYTFKTGSAMTAMQDSSDIYKTSYAKQYQRTTSEIFQSLVCVYVAKKIDPLLGGKVNIGFGPYNSWNSDDRTQYHFQYGHVKCGLLKWGNIVNDKGNWNANDKKSKGSEFKQLYPSIIANIVGAFQPIAQYYVDHSLESAPATLKRLYENEADKIKPEMYPKIPGIYPTRAEPTGSSGALGLSAKVLATGQLGWDIYRFAGSNFIYDATQMYISQLGRYSTAGLEDTAKSFDKQKLQAGWAMAGAYHRDLQEATKSISIPSSTPSVTDISVSGKKPYKAIFKSVATYVDSLKDLAQNPTGSHKSLAALIGSYGSVVTVGVTTGGALLSLAAGAGAPMIAALVAPLVMALAAFVAVITSIASNAGDPVLLLQILGTVLMLAAVIGWGASMAALFWTALGTNIMRCANPVGPATDLALSYLMFSGTFMLLGMLAFGAMLAVYLPMLPYIYFSLATIHWLLIVVELMIIVVMGVLGMMMPDGQHELWGMSQQTVFFLLNAFLRPVMMVIGLVAANLITIVAVKLINAGFYNAMGEGTHFSLVNPVEAILYLMLYVSLCISAVTIPLQLITRVPDACMQGIGFVHQGGRAIDQDIAGMKQGAEGRAKGASSAMQSSAQTGRQDKQAQMQKGDSSSGRTPPGGQGGGQGGNP